MDTTMQSKPQSALSLLGRGNNMHQIHNSSCRKCGGDTRIHWDAGEKTSGMDIHPLRPAGMKRNCMRCGFEETIDSLDDGDNKVNAKH